MAIKKSEKNIQEKIIPTKVLLTQKLILFANKETLINENYSLTFVKSDFIE